MAKGRSWGRGFLVFASAPCVAMLATFAAPAFATGTRATVLSLGQSATVSPAGITFTTPADGRLHTTDYAAQVTGVAWPADDEAMEVSPPDQLVPGPGGPLTTTASTRLVVFTFGIASPSNTQAASPSAFVTYSGGQGPVDISAQLDPATATSSQTYAVAVPLHDHSVSLVLAEGGVTASFSLWSLTRRGEAPQVLYRDPNNTSLVIATSQDQSLTITRDADGTTNPQDVTLSGATLSYLSPQGTPAPSADQAYLILNIAATYHYDSSVDFFQDFQPLSPDLLTLTVPGSPAQDSQVYSTATDSFSGPDNNDRLFDGTFYFTVPATVTTATLTIEAGAVSGHSFFNQTGALEADHIASPVSFDITLPAVPPAAIQSPPHWPALHRTGAPALAATSGKGASPGSGGLPIPVALAVLAVVAMGIVSVQYLLRRSRTAPVAYTNHVGVTVLGPQPSNQAPDPGREVVAVEVPTSDHPVPAETVHDDDAAVLQQNQSFAPVSVTVLGVVQATGCTFTGGSAPIGTEILAYLVTHRTRAVTADDISLALWPVGGDRGDSSTKTVRNHISALRQALGSDLLAPACVGGGYRISQEVRCDWDEFVAFTHAAGQPGADPIALRLDALNLVTGRPFSRPPGAKRGSYEWPAAEQLVTTMENAIVACGQSVVADLIDAGDLIRAEEAARRAFKATGDPRAAQALWNVVLESANTKGIEAAKRDIVAELGAVEFESIRGGLASQSRPAS